MSKYITNLEKIETEVIQNTERKINFRVFLNQLHYKINKKLNNYYNITCDIIFLLVLSN